MEYPGLPAVRIETRRYSRLKFISRGLSLARLWPILAIQHPKSFSPASLSFNTQWSHSVQPDSQLCYWAASALVGNPSRVEQSRIDQYYI